MRKVRKHQFGSALNLAQFGTSLNINAMRQNMGNSFMPSPTSPASLVPTNMGPDKLEKVFGTDAVKGNKGKGFLGGQQGMNLLGQGLSAFSSLMPTADKTINSADAMSGNIRGSVNNALLTSGNPFGMAAGAINTVIDKTGGFTDASKGLGGGNDALNMISSLALPGAGFFVSSLKKVDKSEEVAGSSGYTGTSSSIDSANQNAGKILFGRGKAKRRLAEAERQNKMATNILQETEEIKSAAQGSSELIRQRNNMRIGGGYVQGLNRVGKTGMKFPSADSIKQAKELVKKINNSNKPNKFEKGGKVNVIPDGALHARKHNIDDIEGITTKGIPVITEEDGGIIQHAEIEVNEIIFNKEVTTELEKLWKDGSDEAAIEAGKLIAKQIMENTVDNTGLLSEVN